MSFRQVFIDCGSNQCKVLEDRIKRGLESEFFAFEPQPELGHLAALVQERHPDVKVSFQPRAVWVRDEPIEFFLATKWGPNHRGGSTLMRGHTRNPAAIDYANPLTVQGFDFSRWLLENFDKDDRLVVKMDIEGAEYPVLERMLVDGSVDLVAEIMIEFHWRMNNTIERSTHDRIVAELKRRTKLANWL